VLQSQRSVAIIGLSCRVPGAESPGQFWENLRQSVDSIHRFTDDELLAAGVPPPLLNDPGYVKAAPVLTDYDAFDAPLFRYSAREASLMDPQQRLFLETCWATLEDAGYDPLRYAGRVGVFAGGGGNVSSYLFAEAAQFRPHLGATASVTHLGNDKDFLATRVSYKLNLRGPAVAVQTACSTSLVAVHLACQSILLGESDMALAGGVSVRVPHISGYLAREGDVTSPEGICRPFGAGANGTVFGSGVGAVLLKSLERAEADGDHIYAVVRGSAINNDGGDKLSYTASSVAGQVACMQAALAAASVDPATIDYVEGHGAATLLGDPLEIEALNRAYGQRPTGRCAVGSVKGNIGHLEAAAGIIGLIKAALSLEHGAIPASLHCQTPNPRIHFAGGPFQAADRVSNWPRGNRPRRAAVNSLGVGGTNAHVILEEAPARASSRDSDEGCLLVLSAQNRAALNELVARYADFLENTNGPCWLDICYTAYTGRTRQPHRLAVVAVNPTDAARQLRAFAGDASQSLVWYGIADGSDKAQASIRPPTTFGGEVHPRWTHAAECFVSGVELDWPEIDLGAGGRRRVSLPTYPFARKKYWVQEPPPAAPAVPASGGLLGARRVSPRSQEVSYESSLTLDDIAFVRDHRIYDQIVVPGAAYLSLAFTAAGDATSIRQVEFIRPWILEERTPYRLQLVFDPKSDEQRFSVFSCEHASQDDGGWQERVQGHVASARPDPQACAVPQLPGRAADGDGQELYDRFARLGLDLGPAFRAVGRFWRGTGELWAEIVAPQSIAPELDRYWMHPAVLDGCFQLVVGSLASSGDAPSALFLPLSVEAIERHRRPGRQLMCHVRLHEPSAADASVVTADLVLFDSQGVLAEFRGFTAKRAERFTFLRAARADLDEWLHVLNWKSSEAPTTSSQPGSWLVVADQANLAAEVCTKLSGDTCVTLATPGTTSGELAPGRFELPFHDRHAWRELLLQLRPQLTGILWLASLDDVGDESAVEPALVPLLALAQALGDLADTARVRLCVATRGAENVDSSALPLNLSVAALRGVLRVLPHELPAVQVSCVDLDPRGSHRDAEVLAAELRGGDGESSVAYRGSRRYVARLQSWASATRTAPLAQPPGESELVIKRRGSLDQLCLAPLSPRPLGPGDVRLHVDSAGMNFRDVLNALGLYPGEAGKLGMECAGRVVEVGPEVADLQVGDEVVALAQGSMATTVVTPAALVCRRPKNLTPAEAAACPVVFATAAFALQRLARLERGGRVLVHGAAGGVGWAVMQLARQAGAEVFATASRDKWAYLRSLGIEHVYDSRSLAFAENVLADTAGHGVDLVVNSLAGEFIPASLSTLAAGGSFVEIGKQGIWSAEQVRARRPDVAYHVFALDQLMHNSPVEVGRVLQGICRDLESGVLQPPPLASYPLTSAAAAFRRMQQGQHVGKLVIGMHFDGQQPVRADATYLVVGGLGGLGATVVRWLCDRGARSIAIVGRRTADAAIEAQLTRLRAGGISVRYFAADVADESQLARVLDDCQRTLPPLAGVFQLAGTLDDGLIARQSGPRMQRVFDPKIRGTWHLHRLTRHMPLDYFVVFSSCVAWLGWAGQAAYAAANAWLEGLILERRRQGLPGVSIAWGPWEQAGMAGRLSDAQRQRWLERGFQFIEPARGAALLGRVLETGAPALGVFRVDWDAYCRQAPASSLLRDLECRAATDTANRTANDVAKQPRSEIPQPLAGASPERLRASLEGFVHEQLRSVLGVPADQALDHRARLPELGLDSLLAVELLHRLRTGLAPSLNVPSSLLFEHPTLAQVTDFLMKSCEPVASGSP
jgi:acyl transferase domain-containing protein/NADPH:quinone reductase-like Zn-dependent oxidoreductase/aryl carrier-like protein